MGEGRDFLPEGWPRPLTARPAPRAPVPAPQRHRQLQLLALRRLLGSAADMGENGLQ